MVTHEFVVIRVLNQASPIYYEGGREHGHVSSCLALPISLLHGAKGGGDHLRPGQLQQVAALETVRLVSFRAGVAQARNARGELRAIAPGVFRLAQGHSNQTQASSFNFSLMLL